MTSIAIHGPLLCPLSSTSSTTLLADPALVTFEIKTSLLPSEPITTRCRTHKASSTFVSRITALSPFSVRLDSAQAVAVACFLLAAAATKNSGYIRHSASRQEEYDLKITTSPRLDQPRKRALGFPAKTASFVRPHRPATRRRHTLSSSRVPTHSHHPLWTALLSPCHHVVPSLLCGMQQPALSRSGSNQPRPSIRMSQLQLPARIARIVGVPQRSHVGDERTTGYRG